MTATTLAEATAQPKIYIDAYMDIELDSTTNLYLWSGAGSNNAYGNTYWGLGSTLSVEAVESSAGVQTREVAVSFAHKGEALGDLNRIALEHSIADNDFRMFLEVKEQEEGGPAFQVPVLMGKVSSVAARFDRIEISVYTAMLDATTSKTLARYWTDDQQRRYVDAGDRTFRHVAGISGTEIEF